MDEVSLALGITGTGGVVLALAAYLVSKGLKSQCLAAKMEMSFDVHQVDPNQKPQTISNLTRDELEIIIVDVLAKHRRNSVISTGGNIVIPNIVQQMRQPSLKEIEEMIKETIHEANHNSPANRSRSGSEESHVSFKSHHSRSKDDHIVILKEEV